MQVTKLGVCLIDIVSIAAFLVQVIIFAEVGSLMAISHHSTVRWCSAGIGRIENHSKPFIFPP